MSTESSYKQKVENKVKKPNRYKVIMHNDDFTPMDFVVYILMTIFSKGEEEAYNLMMQVHKSGSAIDGIYTYDIAKTKEAETITLARSQGYPFKVSVEKE